MTKYTSLETSKMLYEAFPEWKSSKVWMQSYSTSEMGEAHDDYDSTPPEERNKVHVYEWRVTDNPRNRITTGQEVFKWWYSKVRELEDAAIPAYDTDYLLEKLPKRLPNGDPLELTPVMADTRWNAGYYDSTRLRSTAVYKETPAEALAILALELKKEGIL